MVGGALWALLTVAWSVVTVDDVEFGTLAFVAVAASYWVFAVLPPVLIVAGLVALRGALGSAAGRIARSGFALAGAFSGFSPGAERLTASRGGSGAGPCSVALGVAAPSAASFSSEARAPATPKPGIEPGSLKSQA
jgi:hypothetical protein